jgi:hypothetical protein
MQLISEDSNQILGLFGEGYVREQHSDRADWNLAQPDVDEVIHSLASSMFGEMVKSLKSALSLR